MKEQIKNVFLVCLWHCHTVVWRNSVESFSSFRTSSQNIIKSVFSSARESLPLGFQSQESERVLIATKIALQ